jgi:hypothetical protein
MAFIKNLRRSQPRVQRSGLKKGFADQGVAIFSQQDRDA